MMKLTPILAATLALSAALVGCGDAESTLEAEAAPTAATLPDGLILAKAPETSRGVAAVRESAAEGEEVVVAGIVGGRADPIAADRAIFTLLDDAVQTCDEMGSDHGCATPWDACCTPREGIGENVATVQVVGDDGRPLAIGLADAGLAPGDRVVVVGTFEPSPDGAAVTVDATGIHIDG